MQKDSLLIANFSHTLLPGDANLFCTKHLSENQYSGGINIAISLGDCLLENGWSIVLHEKIFWWWPLFVKSFILFSGNLHHRGRTFLSRFLKMPTGAFFYYCLKPCHDITYIRLIHIHCFHQKVDVVTSPSNLLLVQGRRFFPIHMSAAHVLSTVDFTRTAKPHHTCRNVLSLKMYTIHPQALKVS